MMSLDSIFTVAEECRQSGGRNSEQYLQDHHNKTGQERYRQAAQMIVKGFLCFLIIAPRLLFGQGLTSSRPALPDIPDEPSASAATLSGAAERDGATVGAESTTKTVSAVDYGQQTKRILFIVPNFHSVSAGSQLPPQSAKEKLFNATQDSFDYSSFIFVGALAGVAQAQRSTPEFGQGSLGYGRYYWHILADQTDENYFVEGFMPILFRQDTRYYTLGRGGILRRVLYALSRAAVTRTDAGQPTPNYSEVIGAGAAAGLSNLYYPSRERTWTKTGQRWATNVGLDVFALTFKEFWPDLDRKAFKGKF
jgi:hypothetical protein